MTAGPGGDCTIHSATRDSGTLGRQIPSCRFQLR